MDDTSITNTERTEEAILADIHHAMRRMRYHRARGEAGNAATEERWSERLWEELRACRAGARHYRTNGQNPNA
jgi:hypothetical protein